MAIEAEKREAKKAATGRWRVKASRFLGPRQIGLHVSRGDVIVDPDFIEKLRASGVVLEEIQ
jgi:hypothetical protein